MEGRKSLNQTNLVECFTWLNVGWLRTTYKKAAYREGKKVLYAVIACECECLIAKILPLLAKYNKTNKLNLYSLTSRNLIIFYQDFWQIWLHPSN